MTPLGRPVLPDVYCKNATSSSCKFGSSKETKVAWDVVLWKGKRSVTWYPCSTLVGHTRRDLENGLYGFENSLSAMFDDIDEDGNGVIDSQELLCALVTAGVKMDAKSVIVDEKGKVVASTNRTTLDGNFVDRQRRQHGRALAGEYRDMRLGLE